MDVERRKLSTASKRSNSDWVDLRSSPPPGPSRDPKFYMPSAVQTRFHQSVSALSLFPGFRVEGGMKQSYSRTGESTVRGIFTINTYIYIRTSRWPGSTRRF